MLEVLRRLQAADIPASVLLNDVLPARHYDAESTLDQLMIEGEVVWAGRGTLGPRDGKVALYFRDQLPLLWLPPVSEIPDGALHEAIREHLTQRGASFFKAVYLACDGGDPSTVLDALWDLVWAGEVTNDTLAPVRAFGRVRRKKKQARPSLASSFPPHAAGRWSLVTDLVDDVIEPVTPTQQATAWCHQLLDRHGVVTRQAVSAEGIPGGFTSVYPVLQHLEETGRVRRGYFIERLGGAQFALPGAVDRVRSTSGEAAIALAATDPANPYGAALDWPTIEEGRIGRIAGAMSFSWTVTSEHSSRDASSAPSASNRTCEVRLRQPSPSWQPSLGPSASSRSTVNRRPGPSGRARSPISDSRRHCAAWPTEADRMPEGDSYTRAAARFRPILIGKTITSVDGNPNVRKWSSKLIGHQVTELRTNGKHLLFDLDNSLTIHVWLGMPGRWRIKDSRGRTLGIEGERSTVGRPRDERGAARLILRTDHHEVVCYAAPTVEVERTRVIDQAMERLGPDVLADDYDWDAFHGRTSKVEPDRHVADVLLDQRIFSGVGNEYKNEILFLEGLHPQVPFGALDDGQVDALASRARRLMLPNAHRSNRVTTGNRGSTMRNWVYDRAGKPCRRCRTPIVAEEIGDPYPRITYWCPNCQPGAQ